MFCLRTYKLLSIDKAFFPSLCVWLLIPLVFSQREKIIFTGPRPFAPEYLIPRVSLGCLVSRQPANSPQVEPGAYLRGFSPSSHFPLRSPSEP